MKEVTVSIVHKRNEFFSKAAIPVSLSVKEAKRAELKRLLLHKHLMHLGIHHMEVIEYDAENQDLQVVLSDLEQHFYYIATHLQSDEAVVQVAEHIERKRTNLHLATTYIEGCYNRTALINFVNMNGTICEIKV